jgi:hypothetical protein
MITENLLHKISETEQRPRALAPRAEEPTTGRKSKRCKRRNQKADLDAKLEKALKLLGVGQSRRAVAKTLGIAVSTLRAWLKSERARRRSRTRRGWFRRTWVKRLLAAHFKGGYSRREPSRNDRGGAPCPIPTP